MAEPSELGLQLLAAAREHDPEWQEPIEGTPVRSFVVQGVEDGEVLAVSVEAGDIRYWARWNDPAFGQDTTWKQVQQHGRSVWTIWGEGDWREVADGPPFRPDAN